MSFTVSTEFIADSFHSTFLYYTPNLPDHKVFFAVLAEVCYNDEIKTITPYGKGIYYEKK